MLRNKSKGISPLFHFDLCNSELMAGIGISKQKRFVYTKSFSVNQILRNLHSYKLATGDVLPSELVQARERYGNDNGKIYGSLVLGSTHATHHSDDHLKQKRKRRKRKTKDPKRTKTSASQGEVHGHHSDQDEQIRNEVKKLEEPLSAKSSIDSATTSTSLSLLANYCSSDSEDSTNDNKSASPSHSNDLEIPLSIKHMFEDETKDKSKSTKSSTTSPSTNAATCSLKSDSSDDDDLGYFQPEGSDSSENEVEISNDVMHNSRHGTAVEQRWDEERVKWLFSPSDLSTYVCWKCNNVGHLPKDCTVVVNMSGSGKPSTSRQTKTPSSLQRLYSQCREIKKRKNDSCIECGVYSNLAACLECGTVLCDGRGHLSSHLSSHLLNYPSHNVLFSYKLGKLLKCCKPICEVANCYELYVCSHCLSKAFSQHYSMVYATWSRTGLKLIPNALCCEEHFEWHRMNCPNTSEEPLISKSGLSDMKMISEFFF